MCGANIRHKAVAKPNHHVRLALYVCVCVCAEQMATCSLFTSFHSLLASLLLSWLDYAIVVLYYYYAVRLVAPFVCVCAPHAGLDSPLKYINAFYYISLPL